MKTIIKILVMIVILIQLTDRANAQLNAVNEGSYSVSPINGFMNYTYPISNTTIDGYPVSVKVNYVSNLAFTAFEFHGFTDEGVNSNAAYDKNDLWVKMTKTSPAWIIGVNGFAVQVLSRNQRFHSNYAKNILDYYKNFKLYGDPEYKNSKQDMAYSEHYYNPDACYKLWHHDKQKQKEDENIWLIDGYDFCNSLQTSDEKFYQDFIHLLRDDGSVLELRNTAWRLGLTNDRTFTGLYYENGINTNGFAIVEYDTNNYWPTYIRSRIIENSEADWGLIKPRVVRYYPGNGLEYVFKEYVSPFGMREDLQKKGDCAFSFLPKATIFYLEEINSSLKNLTKFERDQQIPTQEKIEILRGRAMIKEFANHKFSYSNNEIVIETFGHKYSLSLKKRALVECNPITKYITDSEMEYSVGYFNGMYYDAINDNIVQRSKNYFKSGFTEGYNNEVEENSICKDTLMELQKLYHTKIADGLYYIDKIVDPGGNTVSFDYESYIVKETNLPKTAYNLLTTHINDQPPDETNPNADFYFHNFRIKSIISQRLKN